MVCNAWCNIYGDQFVEYGKLLAQTEVWERKLFGLKCLLYSFQQTAETPNCTQSLAFTLDKCFVKSNIRHKDFRTLDSRLCP